MFREKFCETLFKLSTTFFYEISRTFHKNFHRGLGYKEAYNISIEISYHNRLNQKLTSVYFVEYKQVVKKHVVKKSTLVSDFFTSRCVE